MTVGFIVGGVILTTIRGRDMWYDGRRKRGTSFSRRGGIGDVAAQG